MDLLSCSGSADTGDEKSAGWGAAAEMHFECRFCYWSPAQRNINNDYTSKMYTPCAVRVANESDF